MSDRCIILNNEQFSSSAFQVPSSSDLIHLLSTDHKSLPASHAGTAKRPCCVCQLHPVSVTHTWCYRLLHL